jgi:hypothetical protein
MRRLFFREAVRRRIGYVFIDERPWDAVSAEDYRGYDLVVACNSLHLCGGGKVEALRRIIGSRPRNVFVVTETETDSLRSCAAAGGYSLKMMCERETRSPYVYHSLEEAREHRRFCCVSGSMSADEYEFRARLRPDRGSWYLDDTVNMSLLWWTDGE